MKASLNLHVGLVLGLILLTGCGTLSSTPQGPPPNVGDLSVDGPYAVASYDSLPSASQYSAATIYYPVDVDHTVCGVAISPGFLESQQHFEWWGTRLASHGFAVIIVDTNEPREPPDLRAQALMAAIQTLRGEGQRTESPLRGRIDESRMAVMGHSMGGGGALLAAQNQGDTLSGVIALTPWLPSAQFEAVKIPALVIAGENDQIAPAGEHAWPHYRSLPSATPRAYLEFRGGDHFIANTRFEAQHGILGRYVIAWLKFHVEGDERYAPLLDASAMQADSAQLSRYDRQP